VYQLHIKHDAKKTSINIPSDNSIYQLKENIHSQIKMKPEEPILFCNGKLVEDSDYMTFNKTTPSV
jgi:hypothetical protein